MTSWFGPANQFVLTGVLKGELAAGQSPGVAFPGGKVRVGRTMLLPWRLIRFVQKTSGGFSAARCSFTESESLLRLCRPLSRSHASLSRSRLQHLLYLVFRRRSIRIDARRQLFALDDHLDFAGVEHFALEQRHRDLLQLVAVRAENVDCRLVAFIHETANLGIDLERRVFAE